MNAYMNEQVWGKRGRQVAKGSHIQREIERKREREKEREREREISTVKMNMLIFALILKDLTH